MKFIIRVSDAKGLEKDQQKVERYFAEVLKNSPISLVIMDSIRKTGVPAIRRGSLSKLQKSTDVVLQSYVGDAHINVEGEITKEVLTDALLLFDEVSQNKKNDVFVQSYHLEERDELAYRSSITILESDELDEGVFSYTEGLEFLPDVSIFHSRGEGLKSPEVGENRFRRVATR